MLGLGRASQLAGWGSTDLKAVLNSESIFSSAISYPGYSLKINNTNLNTDIKNTGEYGLTGYFATDYNAWRVCQMQTVKLLWPTTGIDSGSFVAASMANSPIDAGVQYYNNSGLALVNSNTQLQFQHGFYGGFNTVTLPGGYAQYMDRWLTVFAISAENSSFYTDWTGTNTFNSANPAIRLVVFDTETGALLVKSDGWEGPGYVRLDYSTWPSTTVPAINYGVDYGVAINWFGSSAGETAYEFLLSNSWVAMGKAFDPLSTSNTTWRTKSPDSTIEGATAWLNLRMLTWELDGSNYYVTADNNDLYTEPDNRVMRSNFGGFSTTDWAEAYSTDLFKDRT